MWLCWHDHDTQPRVGDQVAALWCEHLVVQWGVVERVCDVHNIGLLGGVVVVCARHDVVTSNTVALPSTTINTTSSSRVVVGVGDDEGNEQHGNDGCGHDGKGVVLCCVVQCW